YVCRGLQGEARDGAGNVTWKGLTDYVRRQVAEYVTATDYATQALGVKQQPEVSPSTSTGDPLLVKGGGTTAGGLKLYNEGYRLVEGRAYPKAAETLTAAAEKLPPEFVEVYLKRAEAYYLDKGNDAAIQDCRRVLEKDPACAAAYD